LILKNRKQESFKVFSYINHKFDKETIDKEFKDLTEYEEKRKGRKIAVNEILQWKYISR